MGMHAYITKFVPKLAEYTEPLRSLLKKNSLFQWSSTHTVALDKSKDVVAYLPVSKFCNPNQDIVLQSDASSYGLDACVVQRGGRVAYSSRSLKDCEKNYAQIEKELLAIVFACSKFDIYIYGQVLTVHSDHSPL